MPSLRSASLCALSAIILFSCNTKPKNNIVENPAATTGLQPVKLLPKEVLDIQAYQKNFIETATQHFSVTAKQVSMLTSKGGLKITVDPAILINENGTPVAGNIDVSVIELTNISDLFKSNAATVSNGRLLVSGGSYFIGMENRGNKMKIKDGETLQVEFPLLKKDEMELFYGQRNEFNEMNWEPAMVPLKKQFESISFTHQDKFEFATAKNLQELTEPRIYKSLDDDVYYYKTKMTLQKLVDTVNKRDAKVYLQTISFWPRNLPTDKVLDTNYLTHIYGPRKQYILKICRDEEKQKEAITQWQPHSLANQLQKYYTPTNIRSLGWLNCDHFYNPSEQIQPQLELPYAYNNSHIEYFILFKSFNGLMNGAADLYDDSKITLQKIPLGEEVTIIAFTRKNGIIYHAKNDFVIEKNKTLLLDFKEISAVEMNKIFGSNVKI